MQCRYDDRTLYKNTAGYGTGQMAPENHSGKGDENFENR